MAILRFVASAPADVRKEGSAFDLAIAIGILAGSGQLASGLLERFAPMFPYRWLRG